MDKYKLSIIIPMYNAEKYIENCLDSILNSDLPKDEYEVIIINDGSKDNSPEIAQKYVEKHKNFKYLTQENQGQSVARNYGIKECNGKYIWFVDADDMVSSNIYRAYSKIFRNDSLDILEFKAKYITEDNKTIKILWDRNFEYNNIYAGRDVICDGYMPTTIWNLFIKRDFLIENSLFFIPGITHQDSELVYRMFSYAKHVKFIEDIAYIYIKRENSTTTAMSIEKTLKRLLDDITIIKSFSNLAQKFEDKDNELSLVIQNHSNSLLFGVLFTLLKNKKKLSIDEINKKVLSKLKEENYYPVKINFRSIKKNLLKNIFNIEYFLC